ncbi:MAG: DeoR/GlpR family DNA-binding transcription regulator [Terrimicrobiaceae bacterium]
MIAHERHHRMIEFLARHGRAGMAELLALTGVSPATLRRDLDFLGGRDLLVRQHGAVLHPSAAAAEPSLIQKSQSATAAKRKIGRRAADMVPDGATVFIDSGTTCLEVARVLRSRATLTIITNSLPVVAGHEQFQAKLIVIGGERRAVSGALVGRLASRAFSSLKADVALIGASGLDVESGPGTTELLEKDIKVSWIRQARRTVLLCDASKWASASTFGFAPWESIHDFVTDRKPPGTFRPKKTNIHLT